MLNTQLFNLKCQAMQLLLHSVISLASTQDREPFAHTLHHEIIYTAVVTMLCHSQNCFLKWLSNNSTQIRKLVKEGIMVELLAFSISYANYHALPLLCFSSLLIMQRCSLEAQNLTALCYVHIAHVHAIPIQRGKWKAMK